MRLKLEGLVARAIQHEVDHLEGMLFTDKIEDRTELRYVDPAQDTDPHSAATDDPDGAAPSDEPDQQAAAS